MRIHAQMKANILSRIPRDKSFSERAVHAAEAIFGVGERLQTLKATLDDDRNLSEEGRRTKFAEGATALLKDFAKASRPVRVALNHAKAQRDGLQPTKVDKTDVVAAMQREEVRAFMRTLPVGQRIATAMADPAVGEAVLDGSSPALSGLDARQVGELRDGYLQQKFGSQIAEISSLEEVFTEVANASYLVRKSLAEATGLPPILFEERMAPIEQEADK